MENLTKDLTILSILILFFICSSQFLTSEELLAPFLILAVVFFCLKVDPRFFGVLAIVLLVFSAFNLALVEDKEFSNYLAIGAYYSLCATVVMLLANEVLKRKNSLELEEMIPKLDLKPERETKSKKTTHPLQIENMKTRILKSKNYELLKKISNEYLVPLIIITGILGLGFAYFYTLNLKNPYIYPGAAIKILFILLPFICVTGVLFSVRIFELISKSLNKKMWSNVFIFSILSLLGNVFVYFYHLMAARELSPTDYGILNAVMFVFMLIMMLSSSMGKLVTKVISEFHAKNQKQHMKQVLVLLSIVKIIVALFFAVILILGKQYILDYLHIESDIIIWFLAAATIFSALLNILSTYLQGVKSFVKAGIGTFFSTGGRFLFLILTLYFVTATIENVFISTVLALISGMVILGVISFKEIKEILSVKIEKKLDIDYKKYFASFVSILMLAFGSYLLFGPEVTILTHRFVGEEMGFYSVASNLSRIIIYILLPVTAVFFSYFASQKDKDDLNLIKKSLLAIGGFGFLMFLGYALFPELIISIMFTTKYLEAQTYLLFLSAAAVIYTLNILLVNYLITRNNVIGSFILVLSGVGLMIEMNFVTDIYMGSFFVLLNNILCLIAISAVVIIEIMKKQLP